MNRICPHCHLNTFPLNYHEGAADCQQAMREFVELIKTVVIDAEPYISCWELALIDGEVMHDRISKRIIIKEEKDDTDKSI